MSSLSRRSDVIADFSARGAVDCSRTTAATVLWLPVEVKDVVRHDYYSVIRKTEMPIDSTTVELNPYGISDSTTSSDHGGQLDGTRIRSI
jgi:hypothetical protein